jgi:transcription elongation GreA/GreB family factor
MTLKEQLYNHCLEHLASRIQNAEAIIADARESARNETKSSAGDKYETAREMMQQDINMNLSRIAEAKAQQQVLEHIDNNRQSDIVIPGSVVLTDVGNYYIAISAGQLQADGGTYIALSITSPLGAKMKGLKAGDTFSFNNKDYIIENVI